MHVIWEIHCTNVTTSAQVHCLYAIRVTDKVLDSSTDMKIQVFGSRWDGLLTEITQISQDNPFHESHPGVREIHSQDVSFETSVYGS